MATEENTPVPNWLLKLEEQREKRLKARLGHEAGAGALCQKCGDKCPGLDLHFWRKICKLCKCGKEDHDISDDDIFGFVQFQLLGSKPAKAKGILLKGQKAEVILDWTPKGSSNDIKTYLDELPANMIPVKGSEAAKIRKQRLQKQMPAHDIDATLCHALTPDEIKELEEYVAHIRKHCVGQGKIIRLSLFKGHQHSLPSPNAKFISHNSPNQIASSQTVYLQSSDIAVNNLQNLSLRDKSLPNRQNPLQSQNPLDKTVNTNYEQNPSVVNKPRDIIYPDSNSEHLAGANETAANFKPNLNYPNFAPQSVHQIVDNQNPIQGGGKILDVKYPIGQYPNNKVLPNQYPNNPINPSIYDQNPTTIVQYPLTTSNVERHQEQFENPNFEINNANINHSMNQHLNYNPNFINPIEQHQLPVVVGQPIDVKYPQNNENLVVNNANIDNVVNPLIEYNPNFVNLVEQHQNPTNTNCQTQYVNFPVEEDSIPPLINESTHPNLTEFKTQDFKNKPQIPIFQSQKAINPLETQQNLQSVGYLHDITYPVSSSDLQNSNSALISIPSCHECKKVFDDGSIAISAERTENLWHSSCFNCHSCLQPLADLLYFYHKDTDNIYCGRDYAILKGIPRCKACDELIFVKEYCLAEDSTFHIKHFCCFECDEPLAGKQYLMENDQPMCVDCYERLKAEKCQDCGNVIGPEQQGVSLQEYHWHGDANCFACKFCRKALLGNKIKLKNGNLFCSEICFKSYV